LGKDGKIEELFDVFSSLPNLRKLYLSAEKIDKIPENAFKNKQINLTHIEFDN
jgi:Leucine-rich repeat (LRR) protein